MTGAGQYLVVYEAQVPHSCGLLSDLPNVPVGSVVWCGICGRYWKRRSDWRDGQNNWTWERRFERWRRNRRG